MLVFLHGMLYWIMEHYKNYLVEDALSNWMYEKEIRPDWIKKALATIKAIGVL